jgi:hypothetical protein
MVSALSVIVIVSVIVFLGGVAFGMLVLFIVSIHRTSHGTLSEVHGEHAGSISRRVLTRGRVTSGESGE